MKSAAPAGAGARGWGDAIGDRLDRVPMLVLLDVDGTLAPIAPTPDAATVPAGTRSVVGRLAASPGVTVALVSGRAADDAHAVVGIPGVWAIGNHGLEVRDPHGRVTPDPRVREFGPRVADARGRLERELGGIDGLIVENKTWTLSVHYRLVADANVPRVIESAQRVAIDTGLRPMDGKKIVELRPPVEAHKGTACVAFATAMGVSAGVGSVLYAGDDRTDEDAFHELRLAIPGAVTIRIASPEEQRTMHSRAELVLEGPEALRELLAWVADRRDSAAS